MYYVYVLTYYIIIAAMTVAIIIKFRYIVDVEYASRRITYIKI